MRLRLCMSSENAPKLFWCLYKLECGPLGNWAEGEKCGSRSWRDIGLSQALLLTSYTAQLTYSASRFHLHKQGWHSQAIVCSHPLLSDCLPSCETQECTTFWVYTNPPHLLLFLQSCLQPHRHQSCSTLTPVKLGMVPGLTLVPTLAVLSPKLPPGQRNTMYRISLVHTSSSLKVPPPTYLLTHWLCLGTSSSLKPSQAASIFTLHLPEVTVFLSVPSLGIISSLNRYLSPTTCKGRMAGAGGVLSHKIGKNL